MRRAEFLSTQPEVLEALLRECEYGVLSLCVDDEPYGVAVNFVWYEQQLFFHGALEGKKVRMIARNPQASFSVVRPLSLIPSYFSNTTAACPASQLFSSVCFLGKISCVDEPLLKARALNALMQKLQPEGQYEPIEANNPLYTKMMMQTMVYALVPSEISLKLKAGQNLSLERKALWIEKLNERGTPLDLLTIKVMQSCQG